MVVVGSPNSSPDPTLGTILQRHNVPGEECRRLEKKPTYLSVVHTSLQLGQVYSARSLESIYQRTRTEELDLAGWVVVP
jgi:threonine aldolase